MLKIGIECESIEGPESWGVGRIVKKLLEEIANRPELAQEFKFFLYFKSKIPDYPWLANPIFVKKTVLKHSNILQNVGMNSFSLYYYICLPIKLWFEKLDMMFFPNYMLPILFRGKSLVVLTEDIYYEINSGTLPWRYKLAYRIFAGWWTVRNATKIMAISETSKRELTKLFSISPERIVVNQLGVAEPRIKNYELRIKEGVFQTSNPEGERVPYGAGQKLATRNYILYVGQAFPRRHLRETMLAFEKLLTSHTERLNLVEAQPLSNLKLIAIGKDKYNPPIIGDLVKKINGRLGRDAIPGSRSSTNVLQSKTLLKNPVEFSLPGIIWKEYVSEDELATLYANAKCVIYVSSREAFGLPPLEALSYGVPAVVADQPITREIFGDNAFFAYASDSLGSSASKCLEAELPSGLSTGDYYSVGAIAEAIKKALTDTAKRQEIIANADQILQKYTWQKFTNRFLDFMRNF